MIRSGKCPYCNRVLQNVRIEQLEINQDTVTPRYHGISLVCPYSDCQKILYVTVDPFAMKEDIAAAVVRQLRG